LGFRRANGKREFELEHALNHSPTLLREFSDIDSYAKWIGSDERREGRRAFEASVLEAWRLSQGRNYFLPGYCAACRAPKPFLLDDQYSAGDQGASTVKSPNWRERLVCTGCNLNNRTRAAIANVTELLNDDDSVWITEQTTPLYRFLAGRYRNLIGSEYLGSTFTPGSTDGRGFRHEDLTRVSFANESFDAVLSFDVLEHIPDYARAIEETYRILKLGALFFWSAPFIPNGENTLIRAIVLPSGEISHLLPPEYHGDPLNSSEGILCFQHFGWDVLDVMRKAGFRNVALRVYWNLEEAVIGPEQMFFVARK